MTGQKVRPFLIVICIAAVLVTSAVCVMVATRGSVRGFFESLRNPAVTSEQSGSVTDSPSSSSADIPASKVSSVPGQPSSDAPTDTIETSATGTESGTQTESDATSSAEGSDALPDDSSSESSGTTDAIETSLTTEAETSSETTYPPETGSDATSAEATSAEITTANETQTNVTTHEVTIPSPPETTGAQTGSSTTAPEPPLTEPEPETCGVPVTTSSPEETTSEGPWRPDPATTIPVPSLQNGEELPDVLIAPNGDEVPGVWVRRGDDIWFSATLPFELGMFESGKWWAFHEYYHVLEYGTYTRVGTTYIGFRADNPLPIYQGEGSVIVIDVTDTVEPGSWW